jgi:hypothetical protein
MVIDKSYAATAPYNETFTCPGKHRNRIPVLFVQFGRFLVAESIPSTQYCKVLSQVTHGLGLPASPILKTTRGNTANKIFIVSDNIALGHSPVNMALT